MNIQTEEGESQHENIVFRDSATSWRATVPSSPDATFDVADYNDASLEDFFRRPVKINSFNWTIGSEFKNRMSPWTLYFNNPRVVNRIANFNLLRCKLHVKFVLNGNGFHYGRGIVAYHPLPDSDDFAATTSLTQSDWVELSQRPHIFLDPTNSQGGTLELPFIFPNNWLSIPAAEWTQMGALDTQCLGLKHANGATDTVTISVFAWAEDVKLSVPTSVDPGTLTPQCREYSPQAKDEYGTGIISRPASIVAGAAGKLTNVPMIGPYARATQMAASAMSGIANLFGYSRPPVITNPQIMRPMVGGNLANTDAHEAIHKLTLDSKQELTIDSRCVGLDGADELAVASIVSRESYVTTFQWPTSAPSENHLFSTRVTPNLWTQVGIANHLPAMCFGSLPFEYWRGTISFRFVIVASAYHKGRLRITYDPQFTTGSEYNVAYTRIIDIAQDRDISIDVGWGQPRTYQRVLGLAGSPPYRSGNGLTIGPDLVNANGTLTVSVVNELTTPNSTVNNDIEVLVFAKMKDDAKFAAPTEEHIQDISWFPAPPVTRGLTPQSGESPDATNETEENRPVADTAELTIGKPMIAVDHTNDVFFGEEVASFRQCLKRYCYHGARSPNVLLAPLCTWEKYINNFPFYRGYAPGAVHNVQSLDPYNYCKMTLLNYITPAFVTRRGGLRQKYYGESRGTRTLRTLMRGSRLGSWKNGDTEEVVVLYNQSVLESDTLNSHAVAVSAPSDWPGGCVTTSLQADFLEMELPYYTNQRFDSARRADFTTSKATFTEAYHVVAIPTTADETQATAQESSLLLHRWIAVGEDFALSMYLAPPIAYLISTPTTVPPS